MSTVLAFVLVLSVIVLLGGWGLMLALALLGVSVSFWNAVLAFMVLRTVVLPPSFSPPNS
jgi:hypothetical protein